MHGKLERRVRLALVIQNAIDNDEHAAATARLGGSTGCGGAKSHHADWVGALRRR